MIEKLSYSCQIVTRVCHTFVTCLFTARPGELRHTAYTLRQSPWHRGQLQRIPVIWLLYNYNKQLQLTFTYMDEYKYPLYSFLCHNLFAEL